MRLVWFVRVHCIRNYLLESRLIARILLRRNEDTQTIWSRYIKHEVFRCISWRCWSWLDKSDGEHSPMFPSTGRAKKSNPLGKTRYLRNCSKFFHQIYRIYRGGFGPHILQISLEYLVAFENYNYLNLNVHFSKWTSN